MRWADKQRAWSWRQVRIIRAVADAAINADPAVIKPEMALDTITEIAVPNGLETEIEPNLTAWEQEYH